VGFSGELRFDGSTYTAVGFADGLVVKYALGVDTIGDIQWSQQVGVTDGTSNIYGITAEPANGGISGNIVVTGNFTKSLRFDKTLEPLGTSDGYVAKLDGHFGQWLWSRRVGGAATDACFGAAIGPANDVAVVCESNVGSDGSGLASLDYGQAAQIIAGPSGGANNEVIIAKYNTINEFKWARRVGGPGVHTGRGLGVSGSLGRLLVGGGYESVVAIDETTSFPGTGEYSSWVASLDWDSGVVTWAERFGGTGFTFTNHFKFDPYAERILVGGYFRGLTQFTDRDATSYMGTNDAFCASIVPK
jgi:hypothetical protein